MDQIRSDQGNGPAPDPRAFARGTGSLLQVVGWVMVFGGCCLGPVIGWFQGPQESLVGADGLAGWFRAAPAHQRVVAVGIVASGVGGLALAVFGFGLQQERPGSGLGAVVTTGVLAVLGWATIVAAVLAGLSWIRLIPLGIQIVLAMLWTILLIFALAAARELREHPPPPDEPVTDDLLEQLQRNKHRNNH